MKDEHCSDIVDEKDISNSMESIRLATEEKIRSETEVKIDESKREVNIERSPPVSIGWQDNMQMNKLSKEGTSSDNDQSKLSFIMKVKLHVTLYR